jgi:hypothetical protein
MLTISELHKARDLSPDQRRVIESQQGQILKEAMTGNEAYDSKVHLLSGRNGTILGQEAVCGS